MDIDHETKFACCGEVKCQPVRPGIPPSAKFYTDTTACAPGGSAAGWYAGQLHPTVVECERVPGRHHLWSAPPVGWTPTSVWRAALGASSSQPSCFSSGSCPPLAAARTWYASTRDRASPLLHLPCTGEAKPAELGRRCSRTPLRRSPEDEALRPEHALRHRGDHSPRS
jgi:hypothetical protein